VLDLIRASRERALTAVNSALIDLYWKVGELVARKIETDGWGKGTVAALSTYIQTRHPGLQGFSPQNVWRMRLAAKQTSQPSDLGTSAFFRRRLKLRRSGGSGIITQFPEELEIKRKKNHAAKKPADIPRVAFKGRTQEPEPTPVLHSRPLPKGPS